MLSGDSRHFKLFERIYPSIKANSHKIGNGTHMNMFAANAEIKTLFNNAPEQARRLIDTVMLYCEEADNFELLYGKLDNIAHIHITHCVNNGYYLAIRKAFTKA